MRAPVTGTYTAEREWDTETDLSVEAGAVIVHAVDMDGEVWAIRMPANHAWCAEQGLVFNSGDLLPVWDLTSLATPVEILDTWG
jgi:hypothetical protein